MSHPSPHFWQEGKNMYGSPQENGTGLNLILTVRPQSDGSVLLWGHFTTQAGPTCVRRKGHYKSKQSYSKWSPFSNDETDPSHRTWDFIPVKQLLPEQEVESVPPVLDLDNQCPVPYVFILNVIIGFWLLSRCKLYRLPIYLVFYCNNHRLDFHFCYPLKTTLPLD